MTDREPLTAGERAVLEAIGESLQHYGYAPTLRELCDRFGWASTNAAAYHLTRLARKGYIARTSKRARTITLVEVDHD